MAADTRGRTRRIDVRVTDTQDAAIREAAALAGETVTTFLLVAAEQRAERLLESRRHLVMSREAFDALSASLEEPAEVVPEFVELFELPRLPSGG